MSRHVAVIDIGKTNAKLALVDAETLRDIDVVTRPNTVRPGPPWPHFDVEGHWAFVLEGLARFHSTYGVHAISVTTHGASIVLLDAQGGLAAPVLDYEHPGPEDLSEVYATQRPGFQHTGSPHLGLGLNVGAQLHWQLAQDPLLARRIRHVVTYPQYWGFRLTGVAATDVTSLGCHTDLWHPFEGKPSALLDRLGLGNALAPTQLPSDVLGPLLPQVARQTGLPLDTPVHCGIHDSNASLLPHLLGKTTPFSVVSTGTWVIAMAVGGAATDLDAARDCLVNVNAFGDPVPSARFMGGREYDLLIQGTPAVPTSDADLQRLLQQNVMLLPSVVTSSGPFAGTEARWTGPEPESGSGARSAAVGFYLALMTTECLTLIGHRGEVHVEGPFARNPSYLRMLATALQTPVHAQNSATGTSQGAALLAGWTDPAVLTTGQDTHAVLPDPALADYARLWMERANLHRKAG